MKGALKYLGYASIVGLLLHRKHEDGAVSPAPAKPAAAGEHAGKAPGEAPPKGIVAIVKRTFSGFMDDDCMTLGSSVAYYTVFSLPPLLLLIISIAGMVFGREAVQNQIQQQIGGLIGSGAADQVQTMVKSAAANHSTGTIGIVFGALMLIFGATGAFIALQDALNKAWHVKPDPKIGGVRNFLTKRLLSFGMIVGLAFLLLVSLAVSAALSAIGGWIAAVLSNAVSAGLLQVAGEVVSLAVIVVLFAAMLKFLPDARIGWGEVWVGAGITGVLFTVGKMLIGIYLGKSGATSVYGAAGSLMLIVLWLYYASLIFLFGAEFTKVWAFARGHEIQPEEGAVVAVQEEREVR